MTDSYHKFLEAGIDLSPLGLERGGAEDPGYFCTPEGADIIGWTGVDGIHYCFVRGMGEIVFSVNPMSAPGCYVHPVARSFEDFLRLLLACGGESALEQAWRWSEAQFSDYVRNNGPTEEGKAVLSQLRERLGLTPMEQPYHYMRVVRDEVDGAGLRYTEEYYKNLPKEPRLPAWKVYFEGNFFNHQGQDHPGKPVAVDVRFVWGDHRWKVPAIYVCGRGLVADLCMQVSAEQIWTFLDRWDLTDRRGRSEIRSREEQQDMEREDPLRFDFHSSVVVNGRELPASHAFGVAWDPCTEEGRRDETVRRILENYGLDPTSGWVIQRVSYPWATRRRPALKTLSLMLEREPVQVPGPRFTAQRRGECIHFTHPVTGENHTLTVLELQAQHLPPDRVDLADVELPGCYTAMTCVVEPELPEGSFCIEDCLPGDRPRAKDGDRTGTGTAAVICAARQTERRGPMRTVCSSLHFQPVEAVKWHMTFYEPPEAGMTVQLL